MPDIPYTTGIPAGPHNPSADQPIMQVNTNSIDTILAVDHFSFNDTNGGWHQQSTYPNLSINPTTASGQLALYSKAGASGSDLYMVRDNIAGTVVNLTTSKISAPTSSSAGISWLPGGILIQWGNVTGFSGSWPTSPQTVTYPTPMSTSTFNVQATFIGPSSSSTGDITINSISATGFVWQFSGSPSSSFGGFYWQAIGS